MPDAPALPRPHLWDRHGLQVRAFLLVAFGMLLPMALLGELGRQGVEDSSAHVLAERQHLAQSIASHVEELLGGDLSKAGTEARIARAGLLLRQYRRIDGVAVDLIDAEGTVLASTGPGALRPGDAAVLAPVALSPWTIRLRQSKTELFAAADGWKRRTLVLIPAFLALAALFTWGAVRSVARPLASLTSSAERIAAGDLDRPIPPLPEDEVGRLGHALETMRAALATSLEEVKRANAGLEERVAERTRALEILTSELKERDARRADLVKKLLSAQEDERRRIARELHDETCQTVTALAVGLDTALEAPSPESGRMRLEAVRKLATRTLDDLHRVIFDLRPSMLDDLGLVPAIRWYASRHVEPHGVAVHGEFEGLEDRLPPEVETAVFRAVQESLANVARHAEARSVLIQMERKERELLVEIEDDGRGFDPGSVVRPTESGKGLGLLGIRERIEILGGHLVIESAPGDGTRVAFQVPLREGG